MEGVAVGSEKSQEELEEFFDSSSLGERRSWWERLDHEGHGCTRTAEDYEKESCEDSKGRSSGRIAFHTHRRDSS
jgi:hypothetical protein